MSTHDLKHLQVRLAKVRSEIQSLKAEQQRTSRLLSEANGTERSLLDQIKRIEDDNRDPVVSEHALLRYVERKYGASLDELRNEILSGKTKEAIKFVGNGKVGIGGGLAAVVKNRTVISVVPA